MGRKRYVILESGGFEVDPDYPAFTTGVVCKMFDMPVWVLKKLDTEGIVSPPRKDSSKARLYSKNELSVIRHCWYYMSEHGVKINGLKVILKLEMEKMG